jgi:hypothetical protein
MGGNIARMGMIRNKYINVFGKQEGNRSDLGIYV